MEKIIQILILLIYLTVQISSLLKKMNTLLLMMAIQKLYRNIYSTILIKFALNLKIIIFVN